MIPSILRFKETSFPVIVSNKGKGENDKLGSIVATAFDSRENPKKTTGAWLRLK